LYLAKRIENDVSGISDGVSAETFANTCESVMTRRGVFRGKQRVAQLEFLDDDRRGIRFENVSDGLLLRQNQSAFRAALSMGTTSTTSRTGKSDPRPIAVLSPRLWQLRQGDFQQFDIRLVGRADIQFDRLTLRDRLEQIAFVEHRQMRDFLFPKQAE
jgi:hypothetical protein